MSEIILKGISAAPGIASGPAFIVDKQDFVVPPRQIMEDEVLIEIARFEEALMQTRNEILDIQKKIATEIDENHAKIFDAHLLVLEDMSLIDDVLMRIREEKLCVEHVFSLVIKKYIQIFENIEDDYLRERVSDVNDVGRRVLKNLMGEDRLHEFGNLSEEMLIIAHDLSPSDTASMYNKNIIAFATDVGGKTSHTAIMAKSLGVPAVVGLKDATLKVSNQDFIIVDGRKGLVIVNPSEETKKSYQTEAIRIEENKDQFNDIVNLPAQTPDGHTVELLANLELPEEIPSIIKSGAKGIGLYRTEYFYMNRKDLPSEEEQFQAYKKVAEAIKPHSVTIRTLDLGGDKFISSLQIPKDMYSFLGWRALRFCLARPDIFKVQLRAILRSSVFGKIRLMYPMVTGVQEFRDANAILEEVKQELRDEKISFDENMPIGIMVEVPSAAMVADLLAKEAAFFSIGTNDLIQYTLAVDRVNQQTDDLYDPEHPAILRFLKRIIDSGHAEGIDVCVCGEMSSEVHLALLLLGLKVDELSMSAINILQIKNLIRNVNFSEAKQLVHEVMQVATGNEVNELVKKRLTKLAPNLSVALEERET
jgi:phosphotransferase system enzyme I (PtsI)